LRIRSPSCAGLDVEDTPEAAELLQPPQQFLDVLATAHVLDVRPEGGGVRGEVDMHAAVGTGTAGESASMLLNPSAP